MKKVKKILCVLLTLCILLSAMPVSASAAGKIPFTDVKPGSWYTDAVTYVYENGMMSGVSANKFDPSGMTTRAMFVTVLYQLQGKPEVTAQNKFTDVKSGSWYENAVIWASENGVVGGVSDTQFAPDRKITREQLTLILYKYAEYTGYDTGTLVSLEGFSDAGKVSSWAEAGVKWAVGESLISGVSQNTLSPGGTASRAQIAVILGKFHQKQTAYTEFKAKNVEDFPDQEVLNLDGSNETNFAVINQDAVVTDTAEGVNRLVRFDEENGVYVFSNINEEISSLKVGSVFYHTYGDGADDYVLLKVGNIRIDGTTATITAAEAELDDFFEYVDIDIEVDVPAESVQTAAAQADGGLPNVVKYTGRDHSASKDFDFSGSIGGIDVNAQSTITLCLSIQRDEKNKWLPKKTKLSVKTDSSISASFSKATDNKPYRNELPKVTIPIYAGIDCELTPFLVANFNAAVKGNVTGKLHTEAGLVVDGRDIQSFSDSSKELSASIKGSFEANFGVGIRTSVVLFKFFNLSLDTEGGINVTGEVEKSASTSDTHEEKHLCFLCLDGQVDAYIKLTGIILKYSFKPKEFPLGSQDFYLSLLSTDNQEAIEFGWGKCPHRQYLVSVSVKDKSGQPVADALVEIINQATGRTDETGKTNSAGLFTGYVYNGRYQVAASSGVTVANEEIEVAGKKVVVDLVIQPEDKPAPTPEPTPTPTPTPSADIIDSGDCGAQGDNVKWKLDGNGVLTIYGKGEMENFLGMPPYWDACFSRTKEVIIEEGVTSISTSAFQSFPFLTHVTIPEGVTKIGDTAFNGTSLTDIQLPESLTFIGASAFVGSGLSRITLPSNIKVIGDGAFEGIDEIFIDPANPYYYIDNQVLFSKDGSRLLWCSPQRKGHYVIPDQVQYIMSSAFSGCNLSSISISANVQGYCSVGTIPHDGSIYESSGDNLGSAFHNNSSLINFIVDPDNPIVCALDGILFNKSGSALLAYPGGRKGTYYIPNYVTEIKSAAFSGCLLTEIVIPQGVTTIPLSAFINSRNLETVKLSETVTAIEGYAFSGCHNLKGIVLPNSITEIGNYAFSRCDNLRNISIPSSVAKIEPGAFSYCTGLASVTIPNSVVSIGGDVFRRCANLSDVYFTGTEEQWKNIMTGSWGDFRDDLKNATIHYSSTGPQ